MIREFAEDERAWLDIDPAEVVVVDDPAALAEPTEGATVWGSTTWSGVLELLERGLLPPLETELVKVVEVVGLDEELADVRSDVF